jgi:hypothetical protein
MTNGSRSHGFTTNYTGKGTSALGFAGASFQVFMDFDRFVGENVYLQGIATPAEPVCFLRAVCPPLLFADQA